MCSFVAKINQSVCVKVNVFVCVCLEYLIERTRNAVGALGCLRDTCGQYGKDKKGKFSCT